jgi:hypothetical protein
VRFGARTTAVLASATSVLGVALAALPLQISRRR